MWCVFETAAVAGRCVAFFAYFSVEGQAILSWEVVHFLTVESCHKDFLLLQRSR